jgi:zinc protease
VGDIQAIFAAYHIPDGGHPDAPALEVLGAILGEDSSGRLYKALVDNKKAAQVFDFNLQLNEPGVILLGAMLNKTDSLEAARTVMLDTIDGVVKEPPSKEEVDRARTRLIKDMDQSLRDSERIGLFISEWNAKGDWRLLFLNRDRLSKVKPEDVQRVAAAYLKSSNRTIGEFIPDPKPDRSEIPAKSDVAAEVKDYKSTVVLEAGEAFDPSPQNIDARTERYTLPSGMKVSLLSKKTRGASVHAVIRLRFGDVDSLKGKDTVASMAGDTLIRGTEHKNRQQIQDEIDKLKAQLRVGGDATGANVSIETTRENLPAVLRLAGEILKEPTFPETEFELVRKDQITSDEFGRSEPQVVAFNKLHRTMYPFPKGDVRGTLSVDEEIEEVKAAKLEDARAFYKKFYGASNGALAVVGDFDAAQVKKAVSDLFGSWKSAAKFERIKTGFQSIAPVNEAIETPDKANAVFAAAERVNLSDQDADYPALLFGNYMFGGGFLNSRLASRIRVKDGLSYGIGSSFSAKSDDKDGQLQVFAIAAPQNVAKVEADFREELDKVLKDGFTQKEMDADRTGWLQSRKVSRAEDASLAQTLVSRDLDDRKMAWDEQLEKHVTALTPDDVAAAFRRSLDPSRVTIVKAGDFKKAAGTK